MTDQARPPLPEPVFVETATDLDAAEAGELEVEANFATLAATRGGARSRAATLEVEWRALKELGLRVEPGVASDGTRRFVGSSALAVGLLHEWSSDFHLQAELENRWFSPAIESRAVDPGEPQLPVAARLHAGKRWARWTLRGHVGVEAGGDAAHAPVLAAASLLTGFVEDARFGFFGVEADADFARQTPLVLAPNFTADATPLHLPFRISLALPWVVGADTRDPWLGAYVRLYFLSEREVEYGEGLR